MTEAALVLALVVVVALLWHIAGRNNASW